MSKHTPGPWFVFDTIPSNDIGPNREHIVAGAHQMTEYFGGTAAEQAANAALIARAPDLLAEVETLRADQQRDAEAYNHLKVEAKTLRAQRDALVEAAKEVVACLDIANAREMQGKNRSGDEWERAVTACFEDSPLRTAIAAAKVPA